MLTTISLIALATELALGVHVARLSFRRYAWFAVLMLILSVGATGAIILGAASGTNAYRSFWLGIQLPTYAAMSMATLEIIRRLPEHYGTRLGGYGRKVLVHGLQAAILVSLLSGFVEVLLLKVRTFNRPLLPYTVAFDRMFQFLLAVLLGVIAWEVYLTSVRLSRNVVRHAMLFATYLWAHVAVYFARNLLPPGAQTPALILNNVMLGFDAALFITWIVLLRPAGEALPEKTQDPPEEMAALDAEMDGLRQTLPRISS